MTTLFYSTDLIGNGTQILPGANSSHYIREDVLIGSNNHSAIWGSYASDVDQNFIIEGDVVGDLSGLSISSLERIDLSVLIGENGSVMSRDQAAVHARSTQSDPSSSMAVQNHGLIYSAESSGVELENARFATVENSGTISSDANVGSYAVAFQADRSTIVNSGTIQSSRGVGIVNQTTDPSSIGVFRLTNTGEIKGEYAAIDSAHSYDLIENYGTISGAINLAAGENADNALADHVINSGIITGLVTLGAGDDAFLGETGTLNGMLYGGLGDDTLKSGVADDTIDGGAGADEIWGGAGNDTASYAESTEGVRVNLQNGVGSFGDAQGDRLHEIENLIGTGRRDTLIGDDADNTLDGGNADDVLRGEAGNDILLGGNGEDNLIGGSGSDLLEGGRHQDRLTGGEGDDIFSFLDLIDSGPGQTQRDNITDFTQGEDLIDLSAFGDLTLGGDAFTGTAGEIIHYHVAGDTRTVVEIDIDGDSDADFALLLSNDAHDMTAADFLFA